MIFVSLYQLPLLVWVSENSVRITSYFLQILLVCSDQGNNILYIHASYFSRKIWFTYQIPQEKTNIFALRVSNIGVLSVRFAVSIDNFWSQVMD